MENQRNEKISYNGFKWRLIRTKGPFLAFPFGGLHVPGRFTIPAVSKWPNYSFGHFKTLLDFKMAWPFQNLIDQNDLSHDLQ